MSMIRICLLVICFGGVLLNVVVFWKHKTTKKLRHSSIRTSMELLFFMSVADTVSLLSLALPFFAQYLYNKQDSTILSFICKIDLFAIHSASAFSIWCWFLLSFLRYLAIYKPYVHLRIDLEPRLVAGITTFVCCLLELWICFDVVFVKELSNCGETMPENIIRFFQLSEIIWTYFLPLTLITFLDIKVLWAMWNEGRLFSKDMAHNSNHKKNVESDSSIRAHQKFENNMSGIGNFDSTSLPATPSCQSLLAVETRSQHQQFLLPNFEGNEKNEVLPKTITNEISVSSSKFCSSEPSNMMSFNKSKRRSQQIRILQRFFLISVFDLSMNLPNYVVRLYLTLASESALEHFGGSTFNWIQDISSVLYFAQFALNALYLLMIIYALPSKSRLSTATQFANSTAL